MAKRNHLGAFTLVEVMMVIGLLSFVAVGFMQFMSHMNRKQLTLQVKAEINDIMTDFKGYMSKPGVCARSFQGKRMIKGTASTDAFRKKNGKVIYDTKGVYGNNSVKFESFVISNFDAETEGFYNGTALLTINLKSAKKVMIRKKLLTRTMPIDIQLSELGDVIDCGK